MTPRDNQLPTESDFLDPRSQDPDERHALRNFLGKTAEQAEAMFFKAFDFYREDLTYMRSPAFRFYVLPAMKYLTSAAADGDCDAVSSFCDALRDRLEEDADALRPIAAALCEGIERMLATFDRFDCLPEIYGDVPGRYREILEQLRLQGDQGSRHM